MEIGDLETVLSWRNHPKVRSYMFNQDVVGLVEHTEWFLRESLNSKKHILIFEENFIPLGFLNITQSLVAKDGVWGLYAAPNAPLGTGSLLASEGLTYAFKILGLLKLTAEVIAFNDRSIRLHSKLGFRLERTLGNQHFDGQKHHDVLCFALMATEWK
jgi:UDP-4-amino-4,6-dideoxy-N-acetyl-beta-L-altrosamine N-acetyltransferase